MLNKLPGFDEYLQRAYCVDGKTMRQIAEEVGCSPATVFNHIRRLGIEPRRRGYAEAPQSVVDHCRQLGLSRRGTKMAEESKKKLSEAKKIHGPGHKKIRPDGYVAIYYPDYPGSRKDGYVMEHIYLVERLIGRRLLSDECVHHKNRVKNDNRIENLALMTKREHMSLHMNERWTERRKTI